MSPGTVGGYNPLCAPLPDRWSPGRGAKGPFISSPRHLNHQIGRLGNWAFILTVLVGYLPTIFTWPFPDDIPVLVVLVALGVLYLTTGVIGSHLVEAARSLALWLPYFAIEILLAIAILLVGSFSGGLWIITLPLVSLSVFALPRLWIVVVCALIVLLGFTLPLGLVAGWAASLQNTLFFIAGAAFVIIFTMIAMRERQARGQVEQLAAELGNANEQLRRYAVQAEELATTKERNRLAREIHDSLGHYLTVVNVQLEAAQALLPSHPERALEPLRNAQTLAREGLADVRRSVASLRASPLEDRPLYEAVKRLVEDCRATGMLSSLTTTGAPRLLPSQAELTLFRAAQEALTNVRRHARASRCDVTLDYQPSAVRLTVEDDGVGVEGGEEGFGLLGVRERARDRIEAYSGGMKRRINIAAGLLHGPRIVFMDEPTVGIDPQSRRNILDMVRLLNQEGMTVLYTTHYMEEAQELSDRIAIIDRGQLIAMGTLPELTQLVGKAEVACAASDARGGGRLPSGWRDQGMGDWPADWSADTPRPSPPD